MNFFLKYFFILILLLSQSSFAQPQEKKPRKKHKNTDTVGVVNGTVITFYDYRQQLALTIREHRREIKDTVVSDTAYTRFVNLTWDKMVSDIVIEQELEKRKLALSTDKVIAKLLKDPPVELKTVFTDSITGKFDEKAMKAYLKNPNPDLQRTKILDFYQTLFEEHRLAETLFPKERNEHERIEELEEWLKKKINKANIDDRRTAFGFY
jgi:hypothetical protein